MELHRRLIAFKGIGQKEAAMAFELFEKGFGWSIARSRVDPLQVMYVQCAYRDGGVNVNDGYATERKTYL